DHHNQGCPLHLKPLHCRRKKHPSCRHKGTAATSLDLCHSSEGHSRYGLGPVNRRELIELAVTMAVVLIAGICRYAGAGHVVTFVISAIALAGLARLVGTATEQLGSRLGSGGASVVQSALGNLPELFIAIFALRQGLVSVVQAALVGSILANSVLVLGVAFIVGGLRNGPQRFDSGQAR